MSNARNYREILAEQQSDALGEIGFGIGDRVTVTTDKGETRVGTIEHLNPTEWEGIQPELYVAFSSKDWDGGWFCLSELSTVGGAL